ncbi:MAG: DUF1792 domain-containing protein [Clostridia bacterium]|nr:DUF1792 domain-containing protein [Clostridia bacterium]
MTTEETIETMLESNCSIARFGEGEFELILEPYLDLGFQTHDAKLADRLKGVLGNQNSNLLICIPYALNDIGGRTEHSRKFWFHWGKNRDQHHRIVSLIRQLHPNGYCFGDTQITRPYIAYKTPEHGAQLFPKLKQLWEGRNILFVEGEKTRLGVGNDLFVNARSIKRVLCPATNAFDHYDEILKTIKSVWNGELILLALGPTATVLAADLADSGMRTLDLGHLDIEYEWFRTGATSHDQVVGKYTNEAADGYEVTVCEDEIYLGQILRRVGC